MSKTDNKQLVDLQEKFLCAEESANVIQKKIQQKHIAEASRLFQELAPDLKEDDRKQLSKHLSALTEQAENYFREADTLEIERKLEQARQKYKKVEDIAIDYPGLTEAFRRVDDAMALIRALKHRSKRRKSRQNEQSSSLATASNLRKSRGRQVLLVCFFLLLVTIGGRSYYTNNFNVTFPKRNSAQQVTPLEKIKTAVPKKQIEKNTLSEDLANKLTNNQEQTEQVAVVEIKKVSRQILPAQSIGVDRRERTRSLIKQQLDQTKNSPPGWVSSRQVNYKSGDAEDRKAEGEVITPQNIHPTVDTALKPEETSTEKGFPELQEQVAKRLTVTYSEQPQQTIPAIKQQDESPVEMSAGRKRSAEYVYAVQTDDTLRSISRKAYGTTRKWSAIANANNVQLGNNPDSLQVGMKLIIPPLTNTDDAILPSNSSTSLPALNEDGTYTIQSGDFLGSIAQKLFGTSRKWEKIYELNKDVLTTPHKLKIGQVLRIKISEPKKEMIESPEPESEVEHPAVLGLGDIP